MREAASVAYKPLDIQGLERVNGARLGTAVIDPIGAL
jgi:hypothetical protein